MLLHSYSPGAVNLNLNSHPGLRVPLSRPLPVTVCATGSLFVQPRDVIPRAHRCRRGPELEPPRFEYPGRRRFRSLNLAHDC